MTESSVESMTYVVGSVLDVGNILGIRSALGVNNILGVGNVLGAGDSGVVVANGWDRSSEVLRQRAVPEAHAGAVMTVDDRLASNLLADFRAVVAVDGLAALEYKISM